MVAALLAAAPAWAAEPDADAGAFYFERLCVACHGQDARGDGLMQSALTVPAPDLTRLAADNGGVFPTFRVIRQIDGRDPLLAHGGEMPLFGELFAYPDAVVASEAGQPIMTAQPIADIAAYLASLQE